MVVIVLAPMANGILADAVPEATVVPFTFTVAVASLVVGVTVTDDVDSVTVAA